MTRDFPAFKMHRPETDFFFYFLFFDIFFEKTAKIRKKTEKGGCTLLFYMVLSLYNLLVVASGIKSPLDTIGW